MFKSQYPLFHPFELENKLNIRIIFLSMSYDLIVHSSQKWAGFEPRETRPRFLDKISALILN